jgi:hypothetical protein
MGELVVALAPLVLLALVSVLASYVPLTYLGVASLAMVGLGSLFGLPSGIWYHVVLRRELLARGPLPKGWLWQPTHQHDLLDAAARSRVRLWFVLGGAGFLLIIAGALLGVLALALWYRAGGAA